MNVSENITDCQVNGTCPSQEAIPVYFFVIWDILDKILVVLVNGATILIIYRHRHDMLEIPSNIFIGCLTMADMASALYLPFNIATVYLPSGMGWTVSCISSVWITSTTSLVNTITLCVIAVDRLIYIIYPLEYHLKVPIQRAWRIVYGIWILAATQSLVAIIIGYKDTSRLGWVGRPCSGTFSLHRHSALLIFFPFLLLVPITIGSYVKIGLVALQQRRAIAEVSVPAAQNPPIPGNNHKIVQVMATVLLVYVLCTMVIMATPMILTLEGGLKEIAFRVSGFIWRINTWLNPVIYLWKSQKFRQYVINFLRGNQPTGSVFII